MTFRTMHEIRVLDNHERNLSGRSARSMREFRFLDEPRQMSAAGRFWLGYALLVVVGLAAMVVA